jgi:hypothetical protein
MKKLVCMVSMVAALVSCNGNSNGHSNGQVTVNSFTPSENNVTVTPEVENLGDGLNLQMLGEMVKSSTNAQDVEDKLNSPNSINNLDLDKDGNVDYIKVTEYGDGNNRGLSFTVEMAGNQTQEIATIQIEKANNNVNMNIQGNTTLYGHQGNYASHYSVSDFLLMHYLFSYHRPYFSPYHYGYYPRAYRPYHIVPMSSYHSRVVTSTRTSKITRVSRPSASASSIKSPNATKHSSAVTSRASSMSKPTSSQKSFTSTSASKSKPNTSGFGNSSTAKKSSGSTYGGSSSSSSSRSSGSSYSSSSRRSSGSFGSSSRSGGSRRRR